MSHLVTNFFWLHLFAPEKKNKREILLKLQKKNNQAWNYFMHSIYLCAYFYKKNLIIWSNSHILTPSKLSVSFWVYNLLCNLKFVFVRNASKGILKTYNAHVIAFCNNPIIVWSVIIISLYFPKPKKNSTKFVLKEWSNSPKSKTIWLNRLDVFGSGFVFWK